MELLSSKSNTKKVPVQKVQESFSVRWHVTLQLQQLWVAATASVTKSFLKWAHCLLEPLAGSGRSQEEPGGRRSRRSNTATPAGRWAPAAGCRWSPAGAPASCRGGCAWTRTASFSPSSWMKTHNRPVRRSSASAMGRRNYDWATTELRQNYDCQVWQQEAGIQCCDWLGEQTGRTGRSTGKTGGRTGWGTGWTGEKLKD